MEPSKLKVIRNVEQVHSLIDTVRHYEFVAIDTETTGLHKTDRIIGLSFCGSEDEAYYIVTHEWKVDTKNLDALPGMVEAVRALLLTLTGKNLVGHNAVFDMMMIESNYGIKLIDSLHTDTLVLAHLLNENRRVGLKELGSSLFGEDATKEQEEMKASIASNGGLMTKGAYELYKADSQLIALYGAKDALLTYKLFLHLVPDLYEQGLDTFFYEEESMPLLRGPTYELNTAGLKIDMKYLTSLKKTLEAECAEAKAFVLQEIAVHTKAKYPGTTKANTFNVGSSQQLAWLMFGKLGLEFGTLTKGGKELCRSMGMRVPYQPAAKRDFIYTVQQIKDQQDERIAKGKAQAKLNKNKYVAPKKHKEPWAYIACDKKTLTKLAPKYKWIARLLEYQKKIKILTTYVKGIEARVQYGIIQSSFLQHGTTSGRYSSKNINFQNLPRDDKRVKSCVVARDGKVFVGADYSQLEPRVFAYFSKDQRLLEAFRGADDFYSVIGMEVYDKTDCTPRKDGSDDAFGIKYKALRDLSKVIALASTYGATAHQLSSTTKKSVEDTQMDIDNYFERFPGVAQMMLDSHAMAKRDGQVTNLFGRPRRMPEALHIEKVYGKVAHAELPYEARNVLNLAVNHRIQSTGASIVNRAMIRFCADAKQAGLDCKIVCQVHDSLIVECNEADSDTVCLLLQNAMENTVILEGITLEAVPKVGRTFGDV